MKRLLVCLISFLVGFIVSWLFLDFILPEPTPTEPEQPKYTVSEMMIADLERFSLYRDAPTILHVPTPTESDVTDTNVGHIEPVRYELTNIERDLVEQVVMAESGNQSYLGNAMVAFCILNACEKDGLRPDEVIEVYQYTSNRVEPSEVVREAVSAVFDRGEEPVMDKPLWFYAYKQTTSSWHESQRYICEVGGHRFFGEHN